MRREWVAALAFLLGLTAPAMRGATAAERTDPNAQGSVLVFAAASTANAMDELRQRFQQETGLRVQSSYASSGTLAQQIVHGAAADILLSADEEWAEHLAEHRLVAQRQELLANRLVIVVPADSSRPLQRLEDLAAAGFRRVAMGEPEGVPAGRYAREALTRLQLWDALKGKVVAAEDVRQALAFVETGAADAGIVYATDAAISKRVQVACEVPPRLSRPIRFPLVLLRHGSQNPAAVRYYAYLRSPAAAAVFRKFGFDVLELADPPAP